MKKQIKLSWMLILLLSFGLIGCEKEEPKKKTDENIKEYSLSRKTDYGNDWIYFSFSKGEEVEGINEENRMERLDWDIAFNKWNMRTNSGKSGKGKGGAKETQATKFAGVTTIPTTGYLVDDIIEITKNLSKFPPPQIETPGSKELGKVIIFSGPPPKYTLSTKIFIVKAADGKPVKFKIVSYHSKEGQSGFVTFKYSLVEEK